MNKEDLQQQCANLVGVSSSEKELAFEVIQHNILGLLKKDGDAVKIDDLGVFQYKKNVENNSAELIFSQIGSSDSKTMFLRLPLKQSKFDDTEPENIFSISVGKPIVPLSASDMSNQDSETSYIYIKKRIEARVSEILRSAELLDDFNLWDDYLKSIPENQDEQTEEDSESVLNELTMPDPEPEVKDEDELTSLTSAFVNESELYAFPDEKKEEPDLEDELFNDLETFKNIEENEAVDTNEFFDGDDDETVSTDSNIEEDTTTDEEDETSDDNILFDDSPKVKFDEEKFTLADEDIFDLDKTIFKEKEEKKFDWNWGDELENEIPEEEEESEEDKSDVEETATLEKESEESENAPIDNDPFGTLEQTLELDPEFRMLTSESPSKEKISTQHDEEYRITNLNKPRPIPPPKTKTRFTRLTSPVDEPIEEEVPEKQKSSLVSEPKSGFKSYRDRDSKTNLFVIAGIIIILTVIIYFAFSLGDETSNELLKPAETASGTTSEQEIVTSEPAQTVPPTDRDQSSQDRNPSAANRDNSSQVEEIRISNLIFRRGNDYNVQVSSWRSPIKAEEEVKRLKARGYKAFSVQAYLPSKGGTWHRVRIGGFKSESEARNFLNNTQL